MVGSGSKLGREYPVRAFRLGGPVELARLLDYIPDSNGEQQRLEGLMRKSRLSLAEAKEKYPDWYERRIVKRSGVAAGRSSVTFTTGGCTGSPMKSGWAIVSMAL